MASQIVFRVVRRQGAIHRFETFRKTTTRMRRWPQDEPKQALWRSSLRCYSSVAEKDISSLKEEEEDLDRSTVVSSSPHGAQHIVDAPRDFGDSPLQVGFAYDASFAATQTEKLMQSIQETFLKSTERILNRRPQLEREWERSRMRLPRRRIRREQVQIFESGTVPWNTGIPHQSDFTSMEDFSVGDDGGTMMDSDPSPHAQGENSKVDEHHAKINTENDLLGIDIESLFLMDLLDRPIEDDAFGATEKLDPSRTDAIAQPPFRSLLDLLDPEEGEEIESEVSVLSSQTEEVDLGRGVVSSHVAERSKWNNEASSNTASVGDFAREQQSSISDRISTPLQAILDSGDPSWAVGQLKTDDATRDAVEIQESQPEEEQPSVSRFDSFVRRGVALLTVMRDQDWADLDQEGAIDHAMDEDVRKEALEGLTNSAVVHDSLRKEPANDNGLNATTPRAEAMLNLLSEAISSDMWSSTECNLLLLELALSPLRTEEAIQNSVIVYKRMRELSLSESSMDCAPDTNTYVIMMLLLGKRGRAGMEAVSVGRDMISSNVKLDEHAISIGMRVFEEKNRLREARAFFEEVIHDSNRDVAIPAHAFLSLLHLFQSENMQVEAVALLESCLEEFGCNGHYGVGKLLASTIHWPVRDRQGIRINCSPLLKAILDMLEPPNEKIQANFSIWKRLVSKLSVLGPESTALAGRAFRALRKAHETYWPDTTMLQVGLVTAEATRDAELACDLVVRAHHAQVRELEKLDIFESSRDTLLAHPLDFEEMPADKHQEKLVFEPDNETVIDMSEVANREHAMVRPHPQAFMTAMELCVAMGEMIPARRVIDSVVDPNCHLPTPEKGNLLTLAIKGFAKVGDADSANETLKAMQRAGVIPGEEAYGAVIHCLAIADRREEAHQLFESLASGEVAQIKPGATCFDAALLTCLHAGEWSKALEINERRDNADLAMTPAGFQGSFIASYRLGEHRKALEFVESALQSDAGLDQGCCEVSMKILLKDTVPHNSIGDARKKLREMVDSETSLQPACLALLRSLRIAEIEQKRESSNALDGKTLAKRRRQAWRDALSSVLALTHAADDQITPIASSHEVV